MLNKLNSFLGNILLIGDFNSPRGKEVFTRLSCRYIDNMPKSLTTTLDKKYHRSKENIKFVVDGIFSSPSLKVEHIKVVDGVSDHMAIVTSIKLSKLSERVIFLLTIKFKRLLFIGKIAMDSIVNIVYKLFHKIQLKKNQLYFMPETK